MMSRNLALAAALLAPAALSAQPVLEGAASPLIQPAAIEALSAHFFGDASALGQSQVPAAATPVESQQPVRSGARVDPDWSFTQGKLCTPNDPGFAEYRYAERIPYCARNVTQQMKQEIAAHYGVPQSEWPNYEFDHLIPLSIGGDSHVDNIWPQPHGYPDGSDGKDRLENDLYLQMKAGKIKQAEAVEQIKLWFQGRSQVDTRMGPDPGPLPGPNEAD